MLNKYIIGFIGIGVMGKSMANNLIKAGYKVNVYNRTKERAAELISAGATWKDTPKDIAESSNVIITMLGYPKDVEEVYFGDQGLIDNAKLGTYLIDMTTSSPLLAKQIAQVAQSKGLYTLDAPVSGGDIGAREAKLSIMVGGDEKAYNAMKPLFEVLGTNIQHLGLAGAGQDTKMCNQIAIASNMMGVCEAMVYAKKMGLDPNAVLASISAGAAASWSLSNLAPRMIKGDFAPGFYVKHFIKDMGIAIESAKEAHLELPGLNLAKKLYEELSAGGGDLYGTQALIKILEK
ncbi:MAG: 2-hydroxy-3-oxopropionate reductase [Firmicutes bacterium]|nr:2-hydroxy-3-oxopropionate reductase [Bacillota bacterium]